MSQNLPPNAPEPGPGHANPYYQQADAPDLDAATPVLKDEEQQRLNRKALFFLGGTLLLVLAMAFLVLTGGDDAPRQAPEAPREDVSVPALPNAVTAVPAPAPPPIPVIEDAPAEVPPPLPPPAAVDAAGAPPARIDPREAVMQRRIADAGGNAPAGSGAQASPGTAPVDVAGALGAGGPGATARPTAQPSRLQRPDTTMVRGTYLRCVLETRIISDLDGFASCVVTEPVYSFNGRALLLPKGSKIYGRYASGDFMNNRMAVVWDRVLTPAGVDVTLQAPGVDNLGSSGMPGQYDAHWARRISSALMISLLSDAFKYYAAEEGPSQTGITSGGLVTQEPFESNTAASIQRLAEQAIAENSRRPPTVTLNQGTVVNIYVTQDIDFSNVLAAN